MLELNHSAPDVPTIVSALIVNARAAMAEIKNYNQGRTNELVQAVAWAIYRQDRAEILAEIAVRDTGLGKYEDKVIKNQRKTFGALRDLMQPEAKSVGVINIDRPKGLVEIAKPVGVVAAVCPSTNPGATPANKSMFALKGRNAVILAPSPSGHTTCLKFVEFVREELAKIKAPLNLVQMLPAPITKELTYELMRQADMVTVTGSAKNVREGQSCGTPNACVGAGNVVSIVDATADLADAAAKITKSKIFDYATSCSSDNALVVEADVYTKMVEELQKQGAYLCSPEEKAQLQRTLWDENGKRRKETTAKSAATIAAEAGFSNHAARQASFFLVEETGTGKDYPFSGEKLGLVAALYKALNYEEALVITKAILSYVGLGHSCGLHTSDESHIERIGLEMDVCRILINQSQCFGNGGSFDNGLNFTLSMGGGTWAGNNIGDNLSYKNFINITKVSTTIEELRPSEEELFGSYWARYGK